MDASAEPIALPTATTEETSQLELFKKKCIEHGLLDARAGRSEDEIRDGIDDDATLLRFLRSRQLDVQGALRQFQNAYTARQVNHVCEFYENSDVKDYEETRKIYPHWIGRCDKRGLPICTFELSKLDSKTMATYSESSLKMPHPNTENPKAPEIVSMEQLRSFAFFDGMTRFIMPLLSAVPGRPDPEKPVTRTIIIAEVSGLNMTQLWRLKGYVQDLGKLLANNYPELLERGLIVGAPAYFSTLWRWIKMWIDPVTVSKLMILSPEEVLPVMKTYIDVANIPKKYGGELEHEHGSQPLLDPAIDNILKWLPAADGTFPTGPVKWVNGKDGSRVAVTVGKKDGESRREEIAVLDPRKR